MTERNELPDSEIVIIGGGAVGCGVAYSLAVAGKTDVLLLEKRDSVAAATTAQAAGLVGQVRASVERIRLAMASVATFGELQRDADFKPSWRQVGSLRLALTEERVAEFETLRRLCDRAGLEVELIDAGRAAQLWPSMRFDGVRAILWCPSDGYLQPYDLTMAYRHQARKLGVRFATGTAVQDITVKDGRVENVVTNRGAVRCRTVVNAAGAHAYHVAKLVGLELPIVPVRHEYFVTVPAGDIRPEMPVFRVPDSTLYGRADVNSLLLGGWEPQALSLEPQCFSLEREAPPIEADWSVLSAFAEQLAPRYPAVKELGVRSVFSGWPTFVPDGRFIVGESCRVKGFVMAGGCNAHGVSGSAGIGRHVVESMLEENPSAYVRSLTPDRFTESRWDWSAAVGRARAVYETYYHLAAGSGVGDLKRGSQAP